MKKHIHLFLMALLLPILTLAQSRPKGGEEHVILYVHDGEDDSKVSGTSFTVRSNQDTFVDIRSVYGDTIKTLKYRVGSSITISIRKNGFMPFDESFEVSRLRSLNFHHIHLKKRKLNKAIYVSGTVYQEQNGSKIPLNGIKVVAKGNTGPYFKIKYTEHGEYEFIIDSLPLARAGGQLQIQVAADDKNFAPQQIVLTVPYDQDVVRDFALNPLSADYYFSMTVYDPKGDSIVPHAWVVVMNGDSVLGKALSDARGDVSMWLNRDSSLVKAMVYIHLPDGKIVKYKLREAELLNPYPKYTKMQRAFNSAYGVSLLQFGLGGFYCPNKVAGTEVTAMLSLGKESPRFIGISASPMFLNPYLVLRELTQAGSYIRVPSNFQCPVGIMYKEYLMNVQSRELNLFWGGGIDLQLPTRNGYPLKPRIGGRAYCGARYSPIPNLGIEASAMLLNSVWFYTRQLPSSHTITYFPTFSNSLNFRLQVNYLLPW